MPPTNIAAFNRAAFRRFCRRSLGITEAIESRFERAEKPSASLLSAPKMGAQGQNIVYAFGPIMSDEWASWYRDGEDDFLSVTSPGSIFAQLTKIPDGEDITLLVNSVGGDVAAATAAGAFLDDRITAGAKINARIVGDALSAASTLMLRSTSTEIDPMGLVMIHSPWTMTWGNPDELEKQASTLRKIESSVAKFYASRTPMSQDAALEAMKEETWYSAEEAVEAGLIGRVSDAMPADREAEEMAAAAQEDLSVLCAGVNARRAALYETAIPEVATKEEVHPNAAAR